ncbi:response regulator [Roseivirga sp. E12]|uniref:response regulator n=1 Tax=Roseivirga sp. E12 TaxID=2819237 RepID=UPI001ABC91B5|nr:response regulator [Roseivirga sp. E12]MBO3697680.1 response regulator [Roseivirga sp. E12]
MEQKKILIIDDNRDIIRMIANELKSHHINFNVINANNGLNGVRVAKQELPDLILMDWDMPIMDGLEAIRILKNEQSTRDIPVIMATGKMTNSEDLQTALEAGAVDYVRKPVDFIELSARINTALRLKAQQQAINELLQSEIDLKNRKLSTTSMLIVEKNGLLGQLHNKVTKLESSLAEIPDEELRYQVKQLKRQIANHLDVDSSWDTFKMHFEEVNPHFFLRLNEISQELSHKDLKICAYIKLRMDNKEIARLLNITSGSSRTALYRLKRKLHIPEEENLREVIEQID